MASNTTNMGRNIELTQSQVIEIMENGTRPVWSASQIADTAGHTRATATKRLNELTDAEKVETVKVGNTTAYFLVGIETQPVGDVDDEEPVKRDLRRSFEGRFVGLPSAPWTAVHPNDGPAEGGDKVQVQVEGRPGDWRSFTTRLYENRRRELQHSETVEEEVQALISGELVEKPTVPIEHTDYPDDYDLELNIGVKDVETDKGTAFVAAGVKNYLIRPCNDAVFLSNVEVDWLCPAGRGQEIPTHGFGYEEIDGDNDGSNHPEAVQEVIEQHAEETNAEPHEPPEFPDEKADIVMLSDDCEPRRAYLEARPDGGYRVIPADVAGDELGPGYEPTERFKREVREKTAVNGELHFERNRREK